MLTTKPQSAASGTASLTPTTNDNNGRDVNAKPKPVRPWVNAARNIISPIKSISSDN